MNPERQYTRGACAERVGLKINTIHQRPVTSPCLSSLPGEGE